MSARDGGGAASAAGRGVGEAGPRLGWGAAGALAGAGLTVIETALSPAGETALSALTASGLGVLVGGAGGAVLHASDRALRRVPGWVVRVAFPAVAAALGLVVASRLGAFARLGGPYHALAVGALVAGVLGGAWTGVAASVMFAPPAVLRARLARASGRLVFAGGLAVLAAALAFADRRYFIARYPLGHDALGVGACWFLACALRTACPAMPPARWPRRVALAVSLGLVVLSVAVLEADRQDALRTRYLAAGARSWMLRALRAATDLDRDGYSRWFGGGDCAPLRGAVHPGATEIPGNGVDDNCVLGDGRKVEPRLPPDAVPPRAPSPVNVVLITVDTLRFDRTSLARTDVDTTPALRAWANDALVFDRAYTAGGSTSLSIPSLFRGVYPRRLRWTQLIDTTDNQLLPLAAAPFIPAEQIRARFGVPTEDPSWPLARWLAWRGMRTAAVVDDGAIAEILDRRYVGAGFESFVDVDGLTVPHPNDDAATVTAAIEVVERLRQDERPFFLWVHLFGLHGPNPPRPEIPRLTEDAWGEYDQALTYLDRQLARLLSALGPLKERTVIVLTSDHGERIVGSSRFHGQDMLETSIRVPLVVQAPGARTGIDHTLVGTIDLLPTLLALTQTPAPSQLDGLDLSALIRSGQAIAPRILLSDTWLMSRTGERFDELGAAFDGRRKFVLDLRRQTRSLVDQDELGAHPPNLVDRESPGPLRDHLLRYLEETSEHAFAAP